MVIKQYNHTSWTKLPDRVQEAWPVVDNESLRQITETNKQTDGFKVKETTRSRPEKGKKKCGKKIA